MGVVVCLGLRGTDSLLVWSFVGVVDPDGCERRVTHEVLHLYTPADETGRFPRRRRACFVRADERMETMAGLWRMLSQR